MKKRVISAIVALAIFIPLIALGGMWFRLAVSVLAVIGMNDFLDLEGKNKRPKYVNGIFYALVLLLTYFDVKRETYYLLTLLLPMLAVIYCNDNKKYNADDAFRLIGMAVLIGTVFNKVVLIRNENIDLIITSPLKRAKETAKIINMNFNVTIIEDNRLMERNFGRSEGLTKSDIKKLKEINPEMNDIWNYNRNIDCNGMETIQDFCNRVYEFLDEISERYKDKNILLVTHGGVSVPIKYYFMKEPLENFVDRDNIKGIKNCEIIKFKI